MLNLWLKKKKTNQNIRNNKCFFLGFKNFALVVYNLSL